MTIDRDCEMHAITLHEEVLEEFASHQLEPQYSIGMEWEWWQVQEELQPDAAPPVVTLPDLVWEMFG